MLKKTQTKTLKSYQSVNEWYKSAKGQDLGADISDSLNDILAQCFGYYAVQIGCPNLASKVLHKSRVRHQFTIDNKQADIASTHEDLPIANDSVDLVIAAHCLSYSFHPHALLREIDRITVPEAKLIIVEFNPISLWGARHFVQAWLEKMPWTGRLFSRHKLHDWLSILGFKKTTIVQAHYSLPITLSSNNKMNHWLSKAFKRWLPFMSAVNILVYEKSITPMTPIKSIWQQRILNGGRVASPFAGRQSNK